MKTKFEMPEGEIVQKEMPEWKTPYNHDREFESARTATYTPEPSLTKQEFKEEQDLNVILQRFMKTGEPPPIVLPEHFADLTGRTTYYEMASRSAEANTKFYLLDAKTRAEYQNDPTRWADAVVQALQKGDVETLNHLGIDAKRPEKPQEPIKTDPPSGGTPAPKSGPKASGDPKPGDAPPDPQSDSAK